MKASPSDRRQEPREPAQGDVRLRPAGAIAAAFVGQLLDLSANGFRARHHCLTLLSGERVDFQFDARTGTAQAMWTRIVGDEAETGFSILG